MRPLITLLAKVSGGCAKLMRWLCGMRLATRDCEEDCCCLSQKAVMVRGKAPPTAFHHAVRCVVHGDDFTFVVPRKDLQRMTRLMTYLKPDQGMRGAGQWVEQTRRKTSACWAHCQRQMSLAGEQMMHNSVCSKMEDTPRDTAAFRSLLATGGNGLAQVMIVARGNLLMMVLVMGMKWQEQS